MRKSNWTPEDDEALKKYYADGGSDEVAKHLSVHRYPVQIQNRASVLKVKRNKNTIKINKNILRGQ